MKNIIITVSNQELYSFLIEFRKQLNEGYYAEDESIVNLGSNLLLNKVILEDQDFVDISYEDKEIVTAKLHTLDSVKKLFCFVSKEDGDIGSPVSFAAWAIENGLTELMGRRGKEGFLAMAEKAEKIWNG